MDKTSGKDNLSALSGYKKTKSRQAVIKILEDAHKPYTAEEIFLKLKEKGVSANLSTIYRTLDLLESKNLISKSLINEGKGRYEFIKEIHGHHLVWTQLRRGSVQQRKRDRI